MSTLSGRMIFIHYKRLGTNSWLPSNNISLFSIYNFGPIVSILVAEVADLQTIYDVPIYILTGMCS